MKKTLRRFALGALILSSFSSISYAQKWVDMSRDPNANFYEIVKEGENFFADKFKGKGSGYKQFQRWVAENQLRVNQNGHIITTSDNLNAMNRYQRTAAFKRTASAPAMNWQEVGPMNEEKGHGMVGSGRIENIAIHPTDNNIIYAAAVEGGIWKTTDGGTSWVPTMDNMPSLSTTGIAISKSTPTTLYATLSSGYVYKSVDAAATWTQVFAGNNVRRAIVNPTDANKVVIATYWGIYYTTNGGSTWSASNVSQAVYDIEYKTDNSNIVFAAASDGIYRSTDAGVSFTKIGLSTSGESRIAVTPANPNYVYVAQANSASGLQSIFRSTDAGVSYTKQLAASGAQNNNYFGYNTTDNNGIAWWGMALNASQTNAELIQIGCVNQYASTNGGVAFSPMSFDVHTDVHDIVSTASGKIYLSNDGGVYSSDNQGATWNFLSKGIRARQVYRVAVTPVDGINIAAGAQDMGTTNYTTQFGWINTTGGDGEEVTYDAVDKDILYTTWQNLGAIFKYNVSARTYTYIAPPQGSADWTAPMVADPSVANVLYAATDDLYKYNGTSWTKILDLLTTTAMIGNSFAISPSNSNYMYAYKDGNIYASTNGGTSWNTYSYYYGFINMRVSPSNPSKLYISTTGGVYVSENGGATFTQLAGALPYVNFTGLAIHNTGVDNIYIGGPNGNLFTKTQNATQWTAINAGIPNVEIKDIEVNLKTNKLLIGTYARGIYQGDLLTNSAPSVSITSPANNSTFTAPASIVFEANASDADGSISKVEFFNGATSLGLGTLSTGKYTYTWSGVAQGTYSITAKATDNNNAVTTSSVISVTVNPAAGGGCTGIPSYCVYPCIYNLNDYVQYNGVKYQAQSGGLYNITPGTAEHYWKTIGACGASNQAPVVSLTSPANNTSVNQPATITISANATDDVSISKVEFYNGTTLLNTDVTAPYSYSWTGVTAGTYAIKAIAYDNLNASTSSSVANVTVTNQLPTVTLNTPSNNATFTAPASISITATATDADGTISKVEFFNGTTLLATVTTAPYLYTWANVPAGTYSITAKATDNSNGSTTSTAASVTVNAPANQLPTVTLNTPSNNATFTAPASISITATATDADGTISKVEFFNGTTLLATVTTAPYLYTWANVPAGTYSITAKATDNSNGSTTSTAASVTVNAPANQLPTVTLTSPSNNSTFTAPASISLTATATDADGTISKVEFFNGTTLLATVTTAPYLYTWANVPAGTYSITAKATDNSNGSTTSTAASVTVNAPSNQLPTVTLTSPSNNSTFTAPASISITATATDADGTISKVEFFNGTTLLATVTTAPYLYTWANVPAGTYSITAKATDNSNGTKTSTAASVTVNSSGGCTSPQWTAGNTSYSTSTVVKNTVGGVVKKYACTIPGWCQSASAYYYEPGNGIAWSSCWTDLGACNSRVGINEQAVELELYPNPVTDILTISQNVDKITVMSIAGNVLLTLENTQSVNMSMLSNGYYIIKIEIGQYSSYSRIIKN